ncbi:MAG TPA: DUF3106 domain-containing protein [Myxococcota bacterium]|jgi:hypothetical protein
MHPLARFARASVLLALALLASAPPLLAQDATPESATAAPRAAPPRERTQQIERVRGERSRIIRQAPTGFDGWMRDLPPLHQRQLGRRLHRMPEAQRERFFREWSHMSLQDRRALADRIASTSEARRARELPPHLRTPEMRERLERMSPEERRAYFARAQDWRGMDASERRSMRARLEKFGGMTEGEQQALVDQKFERSSPEQRARILQQLREASRQLRAQRATPSSAEETAPPPAPETSAPD